MIELDRVAKRYDGRSIVGDLSFTVARGEFCALVGPSGSGKSTTLRMINRLIERDGGTIRLDGQDIATLPLEELRRRIGYVIQSGGLFPHWRVRDNIATVPRLLGWPEDRVAKRVDALLALVRLDRDTAGKYPHQLSGGQQQRVGVARALAADPAVLLMDEPFGALDPITRVALRAELRGIHRATGKTIVMVTHDIDEAVLLADKIAILAEGKLVQFGTPAAILARPANDFVRDFVGGAGIGLKLLALETVGNHMRAGVAAEGSAVAASAPLTEALSEMILRHTDRLPVRDESGAIAGTIALADLVA
jgi:osmoprotectant transport system ATP-binding protein